VPDNRIDSVLVNGGLLPLSVTLTGISASTICGHQTGGMITAIQIPLAQVAHASENSALYPVGPTDLPRAPRT
jgi:hypothetical protein